MLTIYVLYKHLNSGSKKSVNIWSEWIISFFENNTSWKFYYVTFMYQILMFFSQALKKIMFIFKVFLLFFKYTCLHFPLPFTPNPAIPTSHHPLSYPPLALSMCPLYMVLDNPFPFSPLLTSPTSPLVTVCLFFISVSLVIFCLLVCFVD